MGDVQLFLLAEVAAKTGLSARALADAARANKMDHYRIQGRRYMSQAQIDSYLAKNAVRVEGSKPSSILDVDSFKDRFLQEHEERMRRAARKTDTRKQ